jgi:hypothetical protein
MHRTDASWKLHAPAVISQYLLYMRLGGLQTFWAFWSKKSLAHNGTRTPEWWTHCPATLLTTVPITTGKIIVLYILIFRFCKSPHSYCILHQTHPPESGPPKYKLMTSTQYEVAFNSFSPPSCNFRRLGCEDASIWAVLALFIADGNMSTKDSLPNGIMCSLYLISPWSRA